MKINAGAMALIALFALAGCKDKDTESIPEDDSGDTTPIDDTGDTDTNGGDDTGDTADTDVPCEVSLLETEPLYGNTQWYYRDAAYVTFDDDASGLAAFTATDGDGNDVPLSVEWDDSGFNATVIGADGAWGGSTEYTFVVDICDASTEVVFSTTAYGVSLEDGHSSLLNNTYYLDMSRATYTKPAGVGAIMSLYLSDPLLLGVMDVTEDELTLMGAPGYIHDTTGDVLQDTALNTWDFGTADFTSSPYFSASGETVFEYDGVEIPVYSFSIEGTFAADGSSIGGASFIGLGDTRNMGPLLGLGTAPDVTCKLLEKYGLTCEVCPDEEMYCLTIAGDFEDAELLEDFTLEVITGEE